MKNEIFLDTTPLDVNIKELLPLEIKMVYKTPMEPLWDYMVKKYHYLGYENMLGPRVKYIVFYNDRPIAAISFNQAVLRVGVRDSFIGWNNEQKRKFLPLIVNNNRFLILPWVKVKNLASHILSKAISMLKIDWYKLYKKETSHRDFC